jgi:FkbM family methyltransferase
VSVPASLHPQSPLPQPYVLSRTVLGAPLQFYIATEEGRSWYDPPELRRAARYDINELAICRDKGMVASGDVVFDLGANNGILSLWLALAVRPPGHVYAFDPLFQNVEIIEKNASLNGLCNITAVHAAVGDHVREVAFDLDSCTVAQLSDQPSPAPVVRVPELTLDAFDAPAPGLVKIDVEGYEGAVLRGARRVLQAAPNLLIELHPDLSLARFGDDANDVLRLVEWSRYETWALLPQWEYALRPWSPQTPIVPDGGNNSWIFARRR